MYKLSVCPSFLLQSNESELINAIFLVSLHSQMIFIESDTRVLPNKLSFPFFGVQGRSTQDILYSFSHRDFDPDLFSTTDFLQDKIYQIPRFSGWEKLLIFHLNALLLLQTYFHNVIMI